MIDLYSGSTSNGVRTTIAVVESGLPYRFHRIDLSKGEQRTPAFLAVNPIGQIPALVDDDCEGGRLALAQSAAILIYIAEKSGTLLPRGAAAKAEAIQWVMFAASDLGPAFSAGMMLGSDKEANATAIQTMRNRATALLGQLETRLATASHLVGDAFTIADIAVYGNAWRMRGAGFDLSGFPNLLRWMADIESRPGVAKALAL
ncbi:MAG: glutathione S-transferase family protein [Rhodospirillales bacterium]|jgi:GST-like protein